MAEVHSKFGGSVIGRVIACPGSVALCEGAPNPETSYAAKGTFAHKVAEYCLLEGYRTADCFEKASLPMGFDPSGQVPGPEIVASVNVFLAAVFAEYDSTPDAELYVEEAFTLDIATAEPGEVFGKNDVAIYHPSTARLAVFDFKNGYQPVAVEDNKQLKFYASGAALSKPEWRIAEVEVFIVQPNGADVDTAGGVKSWVMDPLELLEFVGEVERAVSAAKAPNAELHSGSHCRWCPAASMCPAKERALIDGLGLADVAKTLDEVTVSMLPEPKAVDTARLAKLKTILDALSEYAGQVDEAIFTLLHQGTPVEGFKLVEKVARRKWIDADQEVAAFLTLVHGLPEDAVRPRSLVTITEAERLLKAAVPDPKAFKTAKDDLSLRYTLKESSGLTVAPVSDRRQAVDVAANATVGLADALAA